MTIAIFPEPEVSNCFSIIALVIIRENKTKIANFLKYFIFHLKKHVPKHALRAHHCYNHLAVIIARENEVLNQSAQPILDNHHAVLLISFIFARLKPCSHLSNKNSTSTRNFYKGKDKGTLMRACSTDTFVG